MCKQAMLQNLTVEAKANCNVQKDQHCCGHEDSLEAQIRFAKRTVYDFVACEREMYDAMATDYYDYVVTLRDSAMRYLSHWNHVRRTAQYNRKYSPKRNESKNNSTGKKIPVAGRMLSRDQRTLQTASELFARFKNLNYQKGSRTHQGLLAKPPAQEIRLKDINLNDINEKYYFVRQGDRYFVGNFSAWWEHQVDNYNTRMICGSKCSNVPKFQLTSELFEYTLERLSRFSHILFLENMAESYYNFSGYVGWKTGRKISRKNKGIDVGDGKDKKSLAEMMADSNLAYDPWMTVLDDALYEFAKYRYETNYTNSDNRTLLIQQYVNSRATKDYFRNGTKRNCKNPCCGDCSMWR